MVDLRKMVGTIAVAIGLVLPCPGLASAKQLCISFNTEPYFLDGSIPKKGKCGQFFLINNNGDFPGFLAFGAVCLSADGTTVLFNTTDGYFGGPETTQGGFIKSTGAGAAVDCVASTSGTFCETDSVTVASCSGQTIPPEVFSPLSVVKRSMGD